MRIIILAVAIAALAVPFAHGEVYSNTVGLYKIDLVVGRNLISTPFLPFSASLDDVLGDQLTGSAVKFFSDTIEKWNPVTLNYDRAYYDPTGDGAWKDWDTGGPPTFDFDADVACWGTILSFNPATTITLLGEVSETDRSIEIAVGRNMVGPSFPKEIALDDSNLVASGFTGSANKFFSDALEWWNNATGRYDMVYYDTGDTTWKNWDGTPTVKKITPGEGLWIVVLQWNAAFTWSVPKPY